MQLYIAAAMRLLCAETINQRHAHALCGVERALCVYRRQYVLICTWGVQGRRAGQGSAGVSAVSAHGCMARDVNCCARARFVLRDARDAHGVCRGVVYVLGPARRAARAREYQVMSRAMLNLKLLAHMRERGGRCSI
jgi:hypothetical protein